MKVASLFAGAGGLDLGFIRVGHEVVWANDNFHDAVETYRINVGNHIVEGDVRELSHLDIPDHDILIGGFPCQGFSVANTKRHVNDSRNSLYLEMLRIIKEKKPKFFVAENVKGILSLDKGKVFEMILKDFSEANYDVQYKLLNAADYGVPQNRMRVFIVGKRKDIDYELKFPEPTHGKSDLFNDLELEPHIGIGEALRNIPAPDESHNLKNHEYSKFKLKFNGYIGNRMIDPEKPAPTVTARGDDKGGVVVLHHPSNTRRMSARELAATQSFPLDYEFFGTKSSVYRQIGNAVPPLLAEAIASIFPINGLNSDYAYSDTNKAFSAF